MTDARLTRLERQVRHLSMALAAVGVLATALVVTAFHSQQEPRVLRVRGIIVEDSLGRERILIGAPIPSAAGRVRTDTARVARIWGPRFPRAYMQYYREYRHDVNGMVVLDTNGFDRLAFGHDVPDPNIGRRIARSTGLVINDSLGFERSGYGLLTSANVDRVVLGLDAGGREAVAVFADARGRGGIAVYDGSRTLTFGRTQIGAGDPFLGILTQQGTVVRSQLPADSLRSQRD